MASKPVRVRFAPSPTGYLHVGGARTALFSYLFAKKHQGTFVLRIEDTDLERSTEEALRMQIEDLVWLGLNWDEGPNSETLEDIGEYGPYRQSQRTEIYNFFANYLLENGKAYYDFRTDEELEAAKKASEDGFTIPRPKDILSLDKAREEIKAGKAGAIRFINDGVGAYKFTDHVRGDVEFQADMVGDFVIVRSNGMPVYNFCCVIDDALMGMTHVFRAEDHVSNTLRQLMIYDELEDFHKKVNSGTLETNQDFFHSEKVANAFSKFLSEPYQLPEFAHFSLILGQDKQKLSKRHGATSCKEYHKNGFLPEALVNFLALLGWSHPEEKEIIPLDELIESFDLSRVNKAPAVFDEEKLTWMNSQYLRDLSDEKLWQGIEPLLSAEGLTGFPGDSEWRTKALSTFKTRMETFKDSIEQFRPLSDGAFNIDESAKDALSWESSKTVLEMWNKLVSEKDSDFLTEEDFVNIQNQIKTDASVKGKHLFMPMRVAVIGKPHGAELKELVPLLPKKSLLERGQKVLNSI